MTGRRSHGRLSALNGVVHQGMYATGHARTGCVSLDWSIVAMTTGFDLRAK